MGMECKGDKVVFSGMVYEDAIVELRDFLQERAPEAVVFDLSGCEDIHLGVVQLVLAYTKMYEGRFVYPDEPRMFQKVCEGFDRSEGYCG
ncbi:MAG: hypothetical protein JXK04_02165 [Campylobacterales bacterium]|nr:hypothetical protein [Campylobacterales bacterium]